MTNGLEDYYDAIDFDAETRQMFDKAKNFGASMISIIGYINTAITILNLLFGEESEELGLLKKINAYLSSIEDKTRNTFKILKSQTADAADSEMLEVTNRIELFLKDPLNVYLHEDLRKWLEDLQPNVNSLLNPDFLFEKTIEEWHIGPYEKAGVDWLNAYYWWGGVYGTVRPPFEIPDESEPMPAGAEYDVALLGPASLREGIGRFDPRGYLPWVLKAAVVIIGAHTAMNPAQRTTGRYRENLKYYANGLRDIAHAIKRTIQVTRPIDLNARYSAFLWDMPGEVLYGSMSSLGPLLLKGWPVGAVDSITGASRFTDRWKPSEHGFPELAEAIIKSPEVPFFKSDEDIRNNFVVLSAVAKANQERMANWRALVADSPVPRLLELAKFLDDLASIPPPTKSETVKINGPKWTGHRFHTGQTKEVTVGGELCEARSFIAEKFEVDPTANLKIDVQPEVFFSGGLTKIKYRYYLESYEIWASSQPNLHSPSSRVSREELSIEAGSESGSVNIKVPTFDWYIEKHWPKRQKQQEEKTKAGQKELAELERQELEWKDLEQQDLEQQNVLYVLPELPPLHNLQFDRFYPTTALGLGYPVVPLRAAGAVSEPVSWRSASSSSNNPGPSLEGGLQVFVGISDASKVSFDKSPLEERKGEAVGTGNKQMLKFTYERTDDDGVVTFAIHSQKGQSNGFLWFVVEEEIGNSPRLGAVIRTGIPLAMIGVEYYVPPEYFAYKKHCQDLLTGMLSKTLGEAFAPAFKLPIPSPDPIKDKSPADYLKRLRLELGHR